MEAKSLISCMNSCMAGHFTTYQNEMNWLVDQKFHDAADLKTATFPLQGRQSNRRKNKMKV